jgi:hypothetical protein
MAISKLPRYFINRIELTCFTNTMDYFEDSKMKIVNYLVFIRNNSL